MRLPFCILNVRGDVLDNGEIRFVGATRTLRAARRRIQTLTKLSPGQYIIYNGETGERLALNRNDETKKVAFEGQHSSARKYDSDITLSRIYRP